MNFAVVPSQYPHPRSTALEESIMTATYTFDVFSSLDGFGAHSGNWGGYWGRQGPELLDHRLALYSEEQQDEEPPGNGGVDHAGRTPRLAGRDRRER